MYFSQKHLLARDFGRVFKLTKATSRANVVCEIMKVANKKNVMTDYQIGSKKQALKDYEHLKTVQVRNGGLIVTKKYPGLAASPERVMADRTLVIVECPYAARDKAPAEAVAKKITSVNTWFNKDLTDINWNSNVYYRAIGAMGISQAQSCIFIFWTPKGMLHFTINEDPHIWEQMVPILNGFYSNCLLHEIIDSRLERSMPVRELTDPTVNFKILCNKVKMECRENSVSLPDMSRVSMKNNATSMSGRPMKRFDRRYDTDGIFTRQNLLTSDHMDMFQDICRDFTDGFNEQQNCLLIQRPQMIKPVCPFKKHVQIFVQTFKTNTGCAVITTPRKFTFLIQ